MTLDCGCSEFVKKDEERKMKQSRVISFSKLSLDPVAAALGAAGAFAPLVGAHLLPCISGRAYINKTTRTATDSSCPGLCFGMDLSAIRSSCAETKQFEGWNLWPSNCVNMGDK